MPGILLTVVHLGSREGGREGQEYVGEGKMGERKEWRQMEGGRREGMKKEGGRNKCVSRRERITRATLHRGTKEYIL